MNTWLVALWRFENYSYAMQQSEYTKYPCGTVEYVLTTYTNNGIFKPGTKNVIRNNLKNCIM